MSDLVRRLEFPLETDFVQLSSYSRGTESSGKIKFSHDLKSPVAGRDVLWVEDIVDTGTVWLSWRITCKRKPGVFAVLLFTG